MKKILLLGIKTCLLMASVAQHHNYFKTHTTDRLSKGGTSRYSAARRSDVSKQTLDSIVSYTYSTESQAWKLSSTYIMKYNDRGLQILGVSSDTYPDFDSMTTYLREEYQYDAYDRLVETKRINLGVEAQYGDEIVKYRYNSIGLLVADSTLNIKDNFFHKKEYEYDSDQKLLKEKTSYYEVRTSKWEWQDSSVYSYNSDNLNDSVIYYSKYSTRRQLKVFEYNTAGYNVKRAEYFDEGKGWQMTDLNESTYDEGGNPILVITSTVDPATQKLKYEYKDEYDLDLLVPSEDLIWIREAEEYFNHKFIDARFYKFEDGKWVLFDKSIPYYSGGVITSSADASQSTELWYDVQNKVLNLPAQSQGKLQVYDLQGRLALQQTASTEVSLQHLSSGFYTYLWLADGQQKQGKILR